MNAEERRILDAIDDADALALLRDLIRIPSENPPGEELGKAQHLASYFARHGIWVQLDEVLPGRPNVVAELVPGNHAAGPTLVFNGHLDTVPAGAGWTVDPFGAEVRDGRVFGRGAADMLAGVAAMSAATVALARAGQGLHGRMLVHAVIDEEGDAKGSRKAADNIGADWAIVTEPSGGTVQAYGKGQLNVEVSFRGRAAHSSTPALGHNAVHDAAAFIARIEREHEAVGGETYPGVGPKTYSAGIVRGGTSGSIIPAECTVTIDRRLLPTETLDDALADIERLVDEIRAERPGLDARLRPTLLFPPLPPPADGTLAKTVQAVIAELGRNAPLSGAAGATDGAWYAKRGIPTVIFGPGDARTAHQPDESVAIDDVAFATRVLALTAARLVARAEVT
jgi:acetylornithine deacetylase/succinyl-diaminopimelate desuccinylase family protein